MAYKELNITALRQRTPDLFTEIVREYLAGRMRAGTYQDYVFPRKSPTGLSFQTAATIGRRHVRDFLANPQKQWMDYSDVQFLCAELGMKERAFVLDNGHCRLITGTRNGGSVARAYDPLIGSLYEIVMADVMHYFKVLSPDMEDVRPEGVDRIEFLDRMGYRIDETFASGAGKIQFNSRDCVPLCLYVAMNSDGGLAGTTAEKPLVIGPSTPITVHQSEPVRVGPSKPTTVRRVRRL
ncbi:MAG: hypothetical protein HY516_04755 [Candidatus Aenigmarchaeota archaeon]|nr:hypothetical protein [Candidatus Aenigmarchaeota archaeon]